MRRLIPASGYDRHAVIKSLSTVQTTKQSSEVDGSWEKPLDVWLTIAKNAFVGWALNFEVRIVLRMLFKGAVKKNAKKAQVFKEETKYCSRPTIHPLNPLTSVSYHTARLSDKQRFVYQQQSLLEEQLSDKFFLLWLFLIATTSDISTPLEALEDFDHQEGKFPRTSWRDTAYWHNTALAPSNILERISAWWLEGAVSRCFSAIFDIAGLKPWLSTIAHTRNAPRTSRKRYQVKYWRKGELQFSLGYFFKPKWQNLRNSTWTFQV